MEYTALALPNLQVLHVYLSYPPQQACPLLHCTVSHSELQVTVFKHEVKCMWTETRTFNPPINQEYSTTQTVHTIPHVLSLQFKRYHLEKKQATRLEMSDHIFLKLPFEYDTQRDEANCFPTALELSLGSR